MKIMIVDDEPLILDGLENIIINEFGDSMDIIKAFDGINALEKLKYVTPDLIITDICMPEMSGLELIEKILKSGVCSRFIILTGHADFEYARQAIQYNALDYILKPIDKSELVKIINRISESIEREQERLIKHELDKIREILLYNAPYDDFYLNKNIITSCFPYPLFAVVLIQIEDNSYEYDLTIFDTVLSHFLNKYHVFTQQFRKQIVVLANFENEFCDRVLYKELSCLRIKNNNIIKSSGVSKVGTSIELIQTLYFDALRQSYFNKHSFDEVINKENEINKAFSIIDHRDIASILESNSKEDMDRLLEGYLEKLLCINHKNTIHLNSVYSIVFSDVLVYLQDLGLSLESIFGANNRFDNEFIDIADDSQLKKQVKELIVEVSKYLWNKDLGNRYSESVSRMLDFINANYMKDISLDNIAEKVNLHPNYASSLFKKEMGTSFIQYLNSYRILKAKAFIKRNADLSMEKIAEMVGYENSGHFIKVFKKYCSITPGEFRNKLINN